MTEAPTIKMKVTFLPGKLTAYCEEHDFSATGWSLESLRFAATEAANKKIKFFRRIDQDEIQFLFALG